MVKDVASRLLRRGIRLQHVDNIGGELFLLFVNAWAGGNLLQPGDGILGLAVTDARVHLVVQNILNFSGSGRQRLAQRQNCLLRSFRVLWNSIVFLTPCCVKEKHSAQEECYETDRAFHV